MNSTWKWYKIWQYRDIWGYILSPSKYAQGHSYKTRKEGSKHLLYKMFSHFIYDVSTIIVFTSEKRLRISSKITYSKKWASVWIQLYIFLKNLFLLVYQFKDYIYNRYYTILIIEYFLLFSHLSAHYDHKVQCICKEIVKT